jgi:sialate O-acetylesterase
MKTQPNPIFHLLLTLILFSPLGATAQLEVASFFGDHMVLQREQEIPVWGKATPGDKVTVTFRNTSVTAQAKDDGTWGLRLPEQAVGEPASLQIKSADQTVSFEDVLIGEVWICSGQSNMEWPVERSANPEEEIAAADYPHIRLFDVARKFSPEPVDTVEATWKVCSPESVASFSAVGYYFGRHLWKELNVPIGLVSSNWGGTPAEAWTPLETLEANPTYAELVDTRNEAVAMLRDDPNLEQTLQDRFDRYSEQLEALTQSVPMPAKEWSDPDADLGALEPIRPGEPFLAETNGLVHVRTIFELSEEQASRPDARILLGQVDNFDVTWINGVRVGRTGPETKNERLVFRDYPIPAGTLKPGKNVVLLQIVDVRRIARFGHNIDHPKIIWSEKKSLALSAEWGMQIISDLGRRPETFERTMKDMGGFLWNGMIEPLIPAAFRGVIWYQGESNTSRAEQYRTLFPDMIRAWRAAWDRGDFPFYFVQLANIENRDGWPELREAQRETLSLPNTGMAVIIDIGDPDDVHPKNKQDVGKRLALWALANTYDVTEPSGWLGTLPGIGRFFQEPLPHSGPLFREAVVEDGQIRLRFDHIYGGLETSDGEKLKGFTIAEENGPFLPAEARIENNEVVVTHPDMEKPREVRYGWEVNPIANLTNSTGLPASPFRTDKRSFPSNL